MALTLAGALLALGAASTLASPPAARPVTSDAQLTVGDAVVAKVDVRSVRPCKRSACAALPPVHQACTRGWLGLLLLVCQVPAMPLELPRTSPCTLLTRATQHRHSPPTLNRHAPAPAPHRVRRQRGVGDVGHLCAAAEADAVQQPAPPRRPRPHQARQPVCAVSSALVHTPAAQLHTALSVPPFHLRTPCFVRSLHHEPNPRNPAARAPHAIPYPATGLFSGSAARAARMSSSAAAATPRTSRSPTRSSPCCAPAAAAPRRSTPAPPTGTRSPRSRRPRARPWSWASTSCSGAGPTAVRRGAARQATATGADGTRHVAWPLPL